MIETENTFEAFPKIPRLNREIIITEKLDGTNAQIHITEDGVITAGSRNRWITPVADNYGFARWVESNRLPLLTLGPGRHFGEWWGNGIQRNYGLTEKRFSLFNVDKWAGNPALPACCFVVPTIYRGPFSQGRIEMALNWLTDGGSFASPGFTKPEGIIVYHTAARHGFKVTLENDAAPKGTQPHE